MADTEFYYADTDYTGENGRPVLVEGIADQFGIEEPVPEGDPRIYLALPKEGKQLTVADALEFGVDYTVKDIGVGYIQYEGAGKYWQGTTRKATYNISFDPSKDVYIQGLKSDGYKYTGNPIKPDITLSVSAAKLDDVHYYRNYDEIDQEELTEDADFVDVGTISVVATYHLKSGGDTSSYTTEPATYEITPRPIGECKIIYSENNRYTGYQIKPAVSVFIIDNNKVKSVPASEYTVEYGDNVYPIATLKITSKTSNISGSILKTAKVVIGAPVDLQVTADGSTVTATWVHDIYAGGEEIRILKMDDNTQIGMTQTITGRTQKAVFTGLNNVTNYIVQIRSYQTVNGSKYYSSGWADAKSQVVTTGIANDKMDVVSLQKGTATVTWDKEGDAIIYKIYRAEDETSKGEKLAVYPASTGGYTNSQLESGKTYYYYIEGYAIINKQLTLISESEHKKVVIK